MFGGGWKKFSSASAASLGVDVVNCKATAICIKIHCLGGKLAGEVGREIAKRIIPGITKC